MSFSERACVISHVILRLPLVLVLILGCSGNQAGSEKNIQPEQPGMTVEELKQMPKVDSHAHFIGLEESEKAPVLAELKKQNMKWFTISTMGTEPELLRDQIDMAMDLHSENPEWVDWATSFMLTNWGEPGWESEAIEMIADGFAHGALAVKVWKEIGMVLKDPDSSFVMIDDPRFDLIFDYIESRNKTLVAHIGEPRNCWLPFDSMTVNNDRSYFKENPQYHAYLHPEIPHYWKHVEARDRVLEKHPGLRLVGCHLGSVEFDVDEMAKRFDKYPNFAVDMGARICHFQVQDRQKVRDFIIKYQDRLLYGTDIVAGRNFTKTDIDSTVAKMGKTYDLDYRYFATDQEMEVWEVDGKFHGLALPADVLKKIFHDNFYKWYPEA